MIKLRWHLYRGIEKLPLLTLLAWLELMVVIVITVMLWLSSQQIMKQAELPVTTPETVPMATSPMTKQLDTFFSAVPRVQQVSQAIETLFTVADNYRISLQEVAYRDEYKSGEPILYYTIDFTVQNSYPKIKTFLTALLAAMPYVALEQISFDRDSIDTSQIQTQFKFKLYLDHE
jgi:hypothetical protein